MLGKSSFNFAFIGAGSTNFTLRLLSDILHESDFIEGGELRLVDIDPVVLEEVYEAAQALVASAGRDFTITKHTDFREAMPGVDFVFFTFVTGCYASWKTDVEICTRFGALQAVGDTIGPGGLIRALRNIPVVVEVAREMERVAPNAWAINYSNPEGALCLAIEQYTSIRTFGLCHGTPDTVKKLAKEVYHVPPEQLRYSAAGVNHLTWITKLEIGGQDVYPDLPRLLRESGLAAREPISAQLYDIYGLYPAPGDRHVGEFFPFYLKEQVLREQGYHWGNVDFAPLDADRARAAGQVHDLMAKRSGFADFGTSGESATHFIRALATDKPTVEMANVINRGYIENLSDGMIVELPVFVDAFGLHPQKVGALPDGIAAKCETLGREYRLIAQAAVECSRDLALQAIMIDPLAANVPYPAELLDALLAAYADLLPRGWGMG